MRRVVFIYLLGHLVGGCRNLAAGMSVASALLLALAYGLVPVGFTVAGCVHHCAILPMMPSLRFR